MTYGVGRVCTGVGWGHRDSHFLQLIKRASQLDLRQLFFHYEAERKRKVTESERKGGREREDEEGQGQSKETGSQVLCCY